MIDLIFFFALTGVKLAQIADRRAIEFNAPNRRAHSALAAPLELSLQAFEGDPRSTARKPPPHQIIILNILDMAQDRLARVVTLAAPGFLRQSVEPLFDFAGQAKRQHWACGDHSAIHV